MKYGRGGAWPMLAMVVAIPVIVLGGCGRATGPLPVTSSIEISTRLPVGATVTWGMPLGELSVPGQASLLGIELLDVQGLEVLGTLACNGWEPQPDGTRTHCAPTGGAWPPAGVVTRQVEGTQFGALEETAGILIGVRRLSVDVEGSIAAVKISYAVDDMAYEVVQPWSFKATKGTP